MQADTTANRLLLAFFYSKQNNDVAAIDEFGKALKNDPSSAAAWYYNAQAERRCLDFESAIADLKRARALHPSDKLAVSIERQLGTMLLRNRKSDEALGVWQSLLKARPDDEELCEDIIELHIEEGLFKPAAALLEALLAKTKDPYTRVMRRLRLGDIQHRAGQRQKAIEIYAATLAESGQDTWLEREILAQIEQIFRAEDDLTGLKKEYSALIATYPKRIGLQRRRCRLLADLGEQEEAVKAYRAILELAVGLAVVAIPLSLCPPSRAVLDRLAMEREIENETAVIKDQLTNETENLLKETKGQEEEKLLQPDKLRRMVEELKTTKDRTEALRQYARLDRKLNEMRQSLQHKQDEQLLECAAAELAKGEETKPMADVLEKKEYEKAAEKLKSLKPEKSKSPDQQRRDLARLKATAQRMASATRSAKLPARGDKKPPGKASNNGKPSDKSGEAASAKNSSSKSAGSGSPSDGALSEAIDELAEAVDQLNEWELSKDKLGECKGMCEKVDKLADQLKKLAICRRAECRLSKLCRCCGQCQSDVCCASPNAGGLKAGWGTNTARRSEKDEIVDNGKTTQIQGVKGAGPSDTAVEAADSGSGVSGRRVAAREREFKHQLESFVQCEDVPEAVKDGVKQYFQIIHEADSATSPRKDSKE